MPIYEFYCRECNTIYQFYSRTVNTEKVPFCPGCEKVRLERRVSSFATLSGRKDESGGEDALPDIDESKLENAMA
ncbi:MAG: FmdB family zinc ribbon protein, partial [Calditrichia bacterium]